jgi:hypothetical protein
MPAIDKALRRENKRRKEKYGHQRDGDSVKHIQRLQQKRRDQILKKKRREKEHERESES